MSKKISDFFKIDSKTLLSSQKFVNQTENKTKASIKLQECQVNLVDLKNEQKYRKLELFEEVMIDDTVKDMKCMICRKTFKNNYKLNLHKKNIHQKSLLSCSICSKTFLLKYRLEKHIKTKHPDGKAEQFECDFDGIIFNSKTSLLIHMKVHYSQVQCKFCKKMLKFNSIKSHLKIFHKTDEKHQCKICLKTFKIFQYLRHHEKIHNKKFECQICNKLFPIKSYLNKHIEEDHENPKSFECGICDKKFNKKSNYKVHQNTHNKNLPKPLKCQRCDYATNRQQNFKNHQKVHERRDKKFADMKNPLKCEKCSTFYRNEYFLKKHLKCVHTIVLYQCDLCAKTIKAKFNLIKHMESHIRSLY